MQMTIPELSAQWLLNFIKFASQAEFLLSRSLLEVFGYHLVGHHNGVYLIHLFIAFLV